MKCFLTMEIVASMLFNNRLIGFSVLKKVSSQKQDDNLVQLMNLMGYCSMWW